MWSRPRACAAPAPSSRGPISRWLRTGVLTDAHFAFSHDGRKERGGKLYFLPELLREFSEYRLLLYGAVLVAMMILRPEGFLPNRSRRAELHETEDQGTRWDEDQWEEEAGVQTPEPRITT